MTITTLGLPDYENYPQQMNLIDRDKLIEQLESWIYDYGNFEMSGREYKDNIIDVIHAQPTVNEWIPVSERLPECDKIVLLKIKNGENYWYDNIVTGKRRKSYKFTQQDKEFITTGMLIHELEDIIAWMPIPTYEVDND